ncbi:MAG: hypothetical protein ACLFPJ_03190 [Candidatus Woesearchaeota archaeon]
MFEFLKNIFKKEEEIVVLDIEKKELINFLNKKISDRKKKFDLKLKDSISEIKAILEKIHQNLDKLEKLELMNKNISTKEKQYMQGNRKLFITNVNTFLNKIDLDIDCDSFLKKLEIFNENEKNFIKNLQRCLMILSHFFANETKEIMNDIAKIKRILDKLNEEYKSLGLIKLDEFINQINNYKSKQKDAKKIKEYLTTKNNELDKLTSKINSTKKKIDNIKKSKEYKIYLELIEKKNKLKEKIDNLKIQLSNNFSPLNQSLKKYERNAITPQTVKETIDSPLNSLIKNGSKNIVEMLLKVQTQIENNSIQLKDKKKEKAINMIKKINLNYLDEILNIYKIINEDMKKINKELSNNKINEDITKLEEFYEKLKTDKEKIIIEINKNNEDLEKLKDKNFYINLEKNINKITKDKINII